MSHKSVFVCILVLLSGAGRLSAQATRASSPGAAGASKRVGNGNSDDTPRQVLSSQEWQRVDNSVERGLTFLAAQQQPDGSFPTLPGAQPAVTSLCVLSFMAHGHNPGTGPYGERLERAIQYIIGCQKPSGIIMLLGAD